jgi:hypothetical protein
MYKPCVAKHDHAQGPDPMPTSYDRDVSEHSGGKLSTDDNRRTRYSNDFVRRQVERGEWLQGLLKVILTLATVASVLLPILHWLR